ncbi:hypothetical protein BD408DRAFT_462263 [Parasitella parasitica]|nr:hypothetical protein BD408DRAFT_462263 [Parasitella parasitica]
MIPSIVDSDRCVCCNQVKTAEHLIISCPHKLDIWRPMLTMCILAMQTNCLCTVSTPTFGSSHFPPTFSGLPSLPSPS